MSSENSLSFFGAGGHSHNGVNSTLIDTTRYSIFDFSLGFVGSQARINSQSVKQRSFEDYVVRIINSQVLQPAGLSLDPDTLNGKAIRANTITSTEIQARTITSEEIRAATITANELTSNIVLINNIIRSNNFDGTFHSNGVINNTGTTGWGISYAGSSVFNSATIRGRLTAGDIYIPSVAAPVFSVDSNGALTATSATITGTVSSGNLTATGGTVAGWGIDASGFTKVSGPNTTRVFHNNTSSPDFSARFLAQVETGGDTYRTSLNSTFVEAFSNVASVTNMSLLRPTGLETPSIITPNNGSLPLLTGRVASAQLVAENAIAKVGVFGTGGFSTMGISLAFGLSILTLSASTRDIKRNIEDSTYDEVEELLMNLRPVKFQYKYAPDADELTRRMSDEQVVYGFIAEEVADVNKTLAVFMPKSENWWNREEITYETMAEDFKPSDWDQRAVTSLLVKGYQQFAERINNLESRLQALEGV
jgi:hypothetical protein